MKKLKRPISMFMQRGRRRRQSSIYIVLQFCIFLISMMNIDVDDEKEEVAV